VGPTDVSERREGLLGEPKSEPTSPNSRAELTGEARHRRILDGVGTNVYRPKTTVLILI